MVDHFTILPYFDCTLGSCRPAGIYSSSPCHACRRGCQCAPKRCGRLIYEIVESHMVDVAADVQRTNVGCSCCCPPQLTSCANDV